MARPLRINYAGAFYHVTSRGNEQREIFKSQRDREKFLGYLGSASERYGAMVHCWCLMGNHYHLLLETPNGNLSQIMHHINGAYTTYFNVKRKRAGHLFQGRFKAFLVEADAYALELSRYIHLNPVRAGMAIKPEDYPWSSYRSYIGHTVSNGWLKTELILGCMTTASSEAPNKYREFVEDRLGQVEESPLQRAVAGAILGREEFIAQVKDDHLSTCRPASDIPTLRKLATRLTVEAIMAAVEAELGRNDRDTRRIGLYLSHTLSDLPLRQLGDIFGLRETALCEASRRMRKKIIANPALSEVVARISARVKS